MAGIGLSRKFGNRTLIKEHRAKKEYQCVICDSPIQEGEHYQKATAQADGKFITRIYCIVESWKDIHADVREAKLKLQNTR